MATAWQERWTEIWSSGYGRDRSYCGIAETDEGFAVDVFEGDTCVASVVFKSQPEAQEAALRLRSRYVRTAPLTSSPRSDTPAIQ
jgi:hypothetical protein